MGKEHYEIILALLAEKIEEQVKEIGYLKFRNDYLEKKLAEIEEGAKQDGTANNQ